MKKYIAESRNIELKSEWRDEFRKKYLLVYL